MINEETKRKLREMKLDPVITALELQTQDTNYTSLTFDERVQYVVDYLHQDSYNSTVKRLMKIAQFRLPKAEMQGIHYSGRKLNKDTLLELSTCQFIDNNRNVIIQGFTGSGKTYLACALGKQACKKKIRTKYVRLPDLLVEHNEATLIPKATTKLLKKYSGQGLLILDEWLLEDISEDEQHFLFELFERRHDYAPSVLCTQYRKEDWHARLGGGVHADAIMDRIIHGAVWIEAGSMNMRQYCVKHVL
jgi:DNA replication protein DnaC